MTVALLAVIVVLLALVVVHLRAIALLLLWSGTGNQSSRRIYRERAHRWLLR